MTLRLKPLAFGSAAALPLLFIAPVHAGPNGDAPSSERDAQLVRPLYDPLIVDDGDTLSDVNLFYDWRLDAYADSEDVRVMAEPMVAPTLEAACDWPEPEFFFATDSAELSVLASAKVAVLAACLDTPPLEDELLSIFGHADARGDDEYNRELGLRRANAVAAALVAHGIDAQRIDTYSRGEHLADDDELLHDDRRVTVRLDR